MPRGDELVFLVSAPRSGSTLLQHMLASHSAILTTPEPWFMLHFCYALREDGMSAEFRSDYVALALSQFLQSVPDGEELYDDAVAEMALRIYGAALKGTGKRLFLDKTPRYYLILEELSTLFPQAKFILLVRNPVAIFSSLLTVSLAGDWTRFRSASRWHDLMSAPRLLVEGAQALGNRATTVRYEDLVDDPQATLEAVCRHIDVPFEPGMLDYGSIRFEGTSFVDPKSIYRHTGVVPDYVDAWQASILREPERSFARAYLHQLGPTVVSALGYDYEQLDSSLSGRRSRGPRGWLWQRIIETPPVGGPEFGHRPGWEKAVLRGFALARKGAPGRVRARFRDAVGSPHGAG